MPRLSAEREDGVGALCKKRARVVRDDEGTDSERARSIRKDAERVRDDIKIENDA